MRIIKPSIEAAEKAKKHPGGYVYEIDNLQGPFTEETFIPPHAIIGGWKVDNDGKITGEFVVNPNYRTKSGEKSSIVVVNKH